MKSEWKRVPLSGIMHFKNGKKRPRELGNIPVYGGNGIMDFTNEFNSQNCVIIGRVGAYCGSVFREKGNCWVSDNAISCMANESSDVVFDYYLLKNLHLNKHHIGTSQPLLTQEILNKIEVFCPPLEQQRMIGAVLAKLDDKIELNQKINDNLQQQASALFEKYYTQAYEEVSFTDIIQILGGGTPKTGEPLFWNGKIPFFTPKDVGLPYTLATEKTITEEGLAHCNSQLYPINTVFVTARGTVGKVGLSGVPMAMNQSCYALVGKGENQLLVYFYTLMAVERLRHKASGAVFDAITTRDFSSEQISKLSNSDTQSFLSVADPIFKTILSRTVENQRLAELRNTLLPKLMTGEIDVSDIQT